MEVIPLPTKEDTGKLESHPGIMETNNKYDKITRLKVVIPTPKVETHTRVVKALTNGHIVLGKLDPETVKNVPNGTTGKP